MAHGLFVVVVVVVVVASVNLRTARTTVSVLTTLRQSLVDLIFCRDVLSVVATVRNQLFNGFRRNLFGFVNHKNRFLVAVPFRHANAAHIQGILYAVRTHSTAPSCFKFNGGLPLC